MKFTAIRENHLYQKAYKNGKRFVGKTVAVYVLRDYAAGRLRKANPQKELVNRLGLSVSKKIGGAVERNRAKRLIRHAYKHIDTETPVKTGHLIVLVAREAIGGKKTPDVERELKKLLKKLELI